MDEKEVVKNKIISALKEQNTYSTALDLLIDTCAEVTVLKTKAYDYAKAKKTTVKEKSREGEVREKQHPAHMSFRDYAETQRKELNELGLTSKSTTIAEDDPVNNLFQKVEDAANGE